MILDICIRQETEFLSTVVPLLRGHPDERPTPLEKRLDNVNLNIIVLIFTPDEMLPLLKGQFSDAKRVASQKGFRCKYLRFVYAYNAQADVQRNKSWLYSTVIGSNVLKT